MSVDNGKISPRMGTKLAIDHTNGDLQKVFGTTQHDNQAWYFLSADVNKWAKYKPFRHTNHAIYADHYTDANGNPNTSGARYTDLVACDYGLTCPKHTATTPRTSPASVLNDVWTYNRCQENIDPMQAWDFECYWDSAPPPVNKTPDKITIVRSATMNFDFTQYISRNMSGTDALSWGDFGNTSNLNIGSMYLCAVFATNANMTGSIKIKTSSQTLSQGPTLELTTQDVLNLDVPTTYTHYFLCARAAAQTTLGSESASSTYMALPTDNGSSDVLGELEILDSRRQSITIEAVATGSASPTSSNFKNTTGTEGGVSYTYVGPESTNLSQINYFKTTVSGVQYHYLHLKLKVVASSSGNVVLSNMAISLNQTYFSASGFSSRISCTLKDSSYTTQSQVVINAGQTGYVYLIASAPLLSLDSKGKQNTGNNGNQHFATRVRLYANNVLIDDTTDLRVRNYDF